MKIVLEHLTKRFPNRDKKIKEDIVAVNDFSFEIPDGKLIGLLGPSGCGKSTIFRLINRLLPLKSGEIRIDGYSIHEKKNPCGYMPQQDLLFPWRTVEENLRLPMEIRGGYSKAEMKEKTSEALKNAGLEAWGQKAPSELSGGMRQRAAFARTLLTGAELLLLDEPFSALDYLTRISMREWLLQQWQREKKTVLFITHDVEEAIFLSGRVLVAEQTPITALSSVAVPLGYPRSIGMMKDPAVLELKELLLQKLRRDAV